MKKAFYALAVACVLLSISSCVVKQSQKIYIPLYGAKFFISKDMISTGESLKEKYPDNDFVYNRITQTYTFEVDESLLKKKDEDAPKKKKKKKKAKEKTVYLDVDDDVADIMRKLDDAVEADWPESGVTIHEKNESDIIALDDNLSYSSALFYNGTQSLSGITATYANTSSTEFRVSTYHKNYESEGTFYSDAKLAMYSVPMYTIGNTLQLNYTRTYHDYRYLTTIYLPDDAPVKEKVISFEIPAGLDIEIKEYNFEGYTITRTEGPAPEKSDDADEDEDGKKTKKKGKSKKKKKKKAPTADANTKIVNYTIKNAPAMDFESANYGPTHSVPHLLVTCKSYSNGTDTLQLMNNTDDLYSWYSNLAAKMDNDSSEIKKVAEKVIIGKFSDEERISAIFYWVQDNIRYVAFEDGLAAFVPDNCQDVYEKRYGDCKGMANLTKEMLRAIGYDARLTWIGTSRIAYPGNMPSLSSANHMICAVYPDSTNKKKRYFLDGTEKFVSFGDYADRIQGRIVVIEDGKKYIVDTIPSFNYDHNKYEKAETYSVSGYLLSGNVKRVYNGESKINVIRSYNDVPLDQRERALRSFLTNRDFNLSVSNLNHTDFTERSKPFEMNYKLDIKNRIITTDKQMYINPEWDRDWANYHIDTGRMSHYSFYHKTHTVKNTTVNIPAGYKVSHMPAPLDIKNEYFQFKLNYKQQGNTVVYTTEIILPKGYLHRNEIKAWNDAVEKLTAFYDSYIVLTK